MSFQKQFPLTYNTASLYVYFSFYVLLNVTGSLRKRLSPTCLVGGSYPGHCRHATLALSNRWHFQQDSLWYITQHHATYSLDSFPCSSIPPRPLALLGVYSGSPEVMIHASRLFAVVPSPCQKGLFKIYTRAYTCNDKNQAFPIINQLFV